jgi:hypothetical protein
MTFSSVIDVNRRLIVRTGMGVLNGDDGLRGCQQLRGEP